MIECKHEYVQTGRAGLGYFKCKYCGRFITGERLRELESALRCERDGLLEQLKVVYDKAQEE